MKHTRSDNLSWDSAFQVHNMCVVQEDLQPRMIIQTTTPLSSETTTPQVTTTPPPVAPTPAPVIPLLALVMTLNAFQRAYQNWFSLTYNKKCLNLHGHGRADMQQEAGAPAFAFWNTDISLFDAQGGEIFTTPAPTAAASRLSGVSMHFHYITCLLVMTYAWICLNLWKKTF